MKRKKSREEYIQRKNAIDKEIKNSNSEYISKLTDK